MALEEGQVVEALYAYTYSADGRNVTFDAGERFALLSKANEDWWQVRRNGEKPMYVPANYVRELLADEEEEYSDSDTRGVFDDENELRNDNLVQRTSRDFCETFNNTEGTDDYINAESSLSASKKAETSELNNYGMENNSRPKILPSGVRSLARSLEGSRIPLRGSISAHKVHVERPKSQSLPVGWVLATDKESGRPYYYNAKTNETSWKPPRTGRSRSSPVSPERETPPLGWRIEHSSSTDELRYINEYSNEEWGASIDDQGKTYYYKLDGTETAWDLPEVQQVYQQSFDALDVIYRRSRSPNVNQRMSKTRSLLPPNSRSSDIDFFLPPPPPVVVESSHVGNHRTASNASADSLSSHTEELWPPPPPPTEFTTMAQTIEKQALFSRKKIADSGNKKIKKPSWTSTFVVLYSSNLVFYKDQKSASQKPGLPHGKPESSCELRGGTLEWAPSSSTRKKNAIQISSVSGLQFLLQSDNQSLANEWFSGIAVIIKRLNDEDSSVVGSVQEKGGSVVTSGYESGDALDDPGSAPSTPTSTLSPGGIIRSFSRRRGYRTAGIDENKTKMKDKLRKFIMRRPTIEELEKKGIIKEQVFGCPLSHLCEREKTVVPNFVISCIKAIEERGLSFDGMYRVCGNVSLVQRIRITVDQEEPIKLGVAPFDDVHALTGSLKLYFRELPEPLVPFDFFSGFVEAIRQSTRKTKLGALKSLVGQLPRINYDTLGVLLAHLHKVTEYSEANRMHAQNLAIVWGPNVMKPRYEAGNIAMNMVHQNQIVEFLLLEYLEIFKRNPAQLNSDCL